MKIALITDTHAGVRNDSPAFHNYSKRFYHEVFFPYLARMDINTVIHLGDIVDRRKFVNVNTAYRLRTDFIEPLLSMGVSYHQIIGNHDTFHRNTNKINSFTELFGKHPIRIYTEATEVDFNGTKILFVPWINDENREHTIKALKKSKAQICFGHLELQGFEMYKGAPSSHGDDPNLFHRFDIVCSGHYHHKSSRGNIHYLGAHAEFTWSDYNDARGFHVFDTSDRSLTFIENPLKMFVKVWYNDAEEGFDIDKLDYSEYNGRVVKVIVQEKNDLFAFDRFIEAIEKQNPVDLQIVDDHLNLGLEDASDIVDEAESTLEICHGYIDTLEVKSKDKVKRTITELYNEALTLE